MTNIQETATWSPSIKQLDTFDPVLGGPGGASNAPLQSLTNRTVWLKVQVEAKSPLGHGHAIAEVAGLQNALDGKAPYTHVHAIGGVAGLQGALDAKAPYLHAHAIGDTTGLQAELDAKAPSTHTHGMSGVAGLQAALDAKAPLGHGHVIADVIGLQAALDAKSALPSFGSGYVDIGTLRIAYLESADIPVGGYADPNPRITLAYPASFRSILNVQVATQNRSGDRWGSGGNDDDIWFQILDYDLSQVSLQAQGASGIGQYAGGTMRANVLIIGMKP